MSRTQKYCGGCGSVTLYRYGDGSYKCTKCGWTSKQPPVKVFGMCLNADRISNTSLESQERIDKITRVHDENPEYTQKQLIAFVPETRWFVEKYWKMYVTNQVKE